MFKFKECVTRISARIWLSLRSDTGISLMLNKTHARMHVVVISDTLLSLLNVRIITLLGGVRNSCEVWAKKLMKSEKLSWSMRNLGGLWESPGVWEIHMDCEKITWSVRNRCGWNVRIHMMYMYAALYRYWHYIPTECWTCYVQSTVSVEGGQCFSCLYNWVRQTTPFPMGF